MTGKPLIDPVLIGEIAAFREQLMLSGLEEKSRLVEEFDALMYFLVGEEL